MEIVMTAQGKSAAQMRRTINTVVVLAAGEVFRLPAECERFYIVSGTAWLTDASGDRVLWAGESAVPGTAGGRRSLVPAIVGGLGDTPLVVEFSGAAEGFGAVQASPLQRWRRRLATALGGSE